MKVLIINGSHRAGNTDNIIERIIPIFTDAGMEVRQLKIRDIEIKLPDGCEICAESGICPNVTDEFSKDIEPSLHNYDIYIIATPVYSDGVTPLTKIFWDRIVSWCHPDRMYLKGKKLGVIVHGMADPNSWSSVCNWAKGICTWEECKFGGVLSFSSGSKIADYPLSEESIKKFVQDITQ